MAADPGLATLLELDGCIVEQGDGYWLEIRAWCVDPSPSFPHGIRYALTLHDPMGLRILGYDNAHAVRPGGHYRYAGRRLPYDHRHRHAIDDGVPYQFEDAHRLLADFFAEVDRVLAHERSRR
jgi:hypothetical protein